MFINGLRFRAGNEFILPPQEHLPDYVQVGNQIWKNSNLAINDGGSGIIYKEHTYMWDDPEMADLGPSYYYNLAAAQRIADTIPGWRLPTWQECDTLLNYVAYNYTASSYPAPLLDPNGFEFESAYATNETNFGAKGFGWIQNNEVIWPWNEATILTNTINQSLTSEVHVLSMGITFGQCNFDRENTYSTVRLIKDN